MTAPRVIDLNNSAPIDLLDTQNLGWGEKLQGNILNGHGRDHTANIFFQLPAQPAAARALIADLSHQVTSAVTQERERRLFKTTGIPGQTFVTLLLSAKGYIQLGFSRNALTASFKDAATPPVATSFVDGAASAAAITALADPPVSEWEVPYQQDLHALLIVADDNELDVNQKTGALSFKIKAAGGTVVHIERGKALRTPEGEGIEHFGYVDGRSQPLYTLHDFSLNSNGTLRIFADGKPRESNGGRIDAFNPFAPLSIVLLRDPLSGDPEAFGSYFVFRKLEQNVRAFKYAEQLLADVLGLQGADRERAGAMAVGRFEDGTPVVLSQTDGFLPEKENNFNYLPDSKAQKCPFQAHIRKTNPRGESPDPTGEIERRITRRGITFGDRPNTPQSFQSLDQLPSQGVGLLFMCFQSSIPRQFGFMQKFWVNNEDFSKPKTGLDPVIGQSETGAPVNHTWRSRWGADDPGFPNPEDVSFLMRHFEPRVGATGSLMKPFVRMNGGEFFFAPSIPFLRKPQP